MDSKHIEDLLSKYWNCETSLEEEQQLREYFAQEEIPDALKEPAALFRYFHEQKKKSLDDPAFPEIPMEVTRKPSRPKTMRLFYNTMRIAAGVIVLVVAGWYIRSEVRQETPQEIVDTYSDPQLAFEETKRALLMISKGFGTAEEQARKINMFNEAQQKIKNPAPVKKTGDKGRSNI